VRVAALAAPSVVLRDRDLSRWRLVEDFQARLRQTTERAGGVLHPSWSDPQRLLGYTDYLGLFLLGLLNPVVRTMRALCAASHLARVQREVCTRPVSLGSFSEAQTLLEADLLRQVFQGLVAELPAGAPAARPAGRDWLIQDSSLFTALPRMHWTLWRRQGGAPQAQVRLHLSLALDPATPQRATITPGKTCERLAWRDQCQRGDAYVGDAYYGGDYGLFAQLDQAGVAFVVRLRADAVIAVETELPLTAADRQAHVVRAAWVRLGSTERYRSIRLRAVWVQTAKEMLTLVSNLQPDELTAAEVALLYKERWRIELFFRWVKCLLGCRHWLAESPAGAAIQLYLALIAAVLLQLYTGQRPNQRLLELIQLHLLGVATREELWAGMQRERERTARGKKI
jgi:hypothetical protein